MAFDFSPGSITNALFTAYALDTFIRGTKRAKKNVISSRKITRDTWKRQQANGSIPWIPQSPFTWVNKIFDTLHSVAAQEGAVSGHEPTRDPSGWTTVSRGPTSRGRNENPDQVVRGPAVYGGAMEQSVRGAECRRLMD